MDVPVEFEPGAQVLRSGLAGCGKTYLLMKVFPHPVIKLASFLF